MLLPSFYSLFYSSAAIVCTLIAERLASAYGVQPWRMRVASLLLIPLGVLCALMFVDGISRTFPWLATPVGHGSSFFGALIGAFAASPLIATILGIPLRVFLDVAATVTPIGCSVGKLGCLCSGCCFGTFFGYTCSACFFRSRRFDILGIDSLSSVGKV